MKHRPRYQWTAVFLVLLLLFSMNPGLPPTVQAGGAGSIVWEFADTPYTWLNDVAWGNNTFVAVGGNAPTTDGAIYTSANGTEWTRITDVPDWLSRHSVTAVTYGAQGFAAVTLQGAILTSLDGQSWTGTQTDVSGFYDVVYGNNLYVAVGNEGSILTSSTKTGWTARTTGIKEAFLGVYASQEGSPLFLAVGQNGVIFSSTNGTTWTAGSSGTTANLRAVADRFTSDPMPYRLLVMVGNGGTVFSSDDAINWTAQTPITGGVQFRDILYSGTQFMAIGTTGILATSTNGTSWTTDKPYVYSNAVSLNGIAMNNLRTPNDRMVLVGAQGLIMRRSSSTDWTHVRGGAQTHIHDLHYGNNRLVAVGRGTFYFGTAGNLLTATETVFYTYSADGNTWTGGAPSFQQILHGVSSLTARGDLYAVGAAGRIQTSADGASWSTITAPVGTPTLNDIISVRYGATGRRLIAVGLNSNILTSEDGSTWVPRSSMGTHVLNGITSFPKTGHLYLAGSGGLVMRSSDTGTNWTGVGEINPAVTFNAIAGTMDMLVLVGSGGWIYTSPDGDTWTSRNSDTSRDLYAVSWNNGQFMAVGADGVIITSPDGIIWTHQKSHTRHTLRAIHYEMAGQTHYVVGDNYTILRSVAGPSVPVTGITLNKAELELFLHGDGETLLATLTPEGASNPDVDWTTDDPDVAVVYKNGHVVPVGEGTTVIRATTGDGGFTATCTVTVAAVTRVAGSNRFWTSVLVSQQGWPEGADTVLLARSHDFADALAGVPLAYALDAPILLTPTQTVYNLTLNEIERLGATHVVLLGGTGAISDDVKTLLEGRGLTVERLAGTGRYATAVEIAKRLEEELGSVDSAIVADGTNFPDALSAASYAAILGQPILLTHPTVLPVSTAAALVDLSIQDVLIVGGPGAVSEAVAAQISVPGEKERVFGASRYSTSTNLARWHELATNYYFLATGTDFPDAITGAVLAAKQGTGVLLTYGPSSMPGEAVRNFFADYHVEGVILFGGAGAISEAQKAWLTNYFAPVP